MASLNKVQLIGRIGQEPEKKTTPTGKSIVKVSIATNEFFTDRSGEKREKTEWHRLVFWEKLANVVAEYCRKGSLIYIEGALRNNEWQDKEGVKRNITEINVTSLQFLDSARKGTESGASSFKQPAAASSSNEASPSSSAHQDSGSNDDYLEDDIPF